MSAPHTLEPSARAHLREPPARAHRENPILESQSTRTPLRAHPRERHPGDPFHEIGRAEGRAEGRAQGRFEGHFEGRFEQ